MEDTSKHIKKMQLQIWLAKMPAERLRQAIVDNEALFIFWKEAKSELLLTGKKPGNE
jgi:hypothetical protein